MALDWNTDWESGAAFDAQDPALAEMFTRALNERIFLFDDPNTSNPDVHDFWLTMVSACHQLGFITYVTDDFHGGVPQTWHEAGPWPPPNGFRRKIPCTINTLSDPLQPGKVARFEYLIGKTSDLEKKYSGRLFEVVDGRWTESLTAKVHSVLEDFGLPKIGDYIHNHILADCKKCIDLAGIYKVTSQWSSKLENNARMGHGSSPLLEGMSETEIQEALDGAKQQAIDSWNEIEPFPADRRVNGWKVLTSDPSIIALDLSIENRHGIAVLERVDADHVRFIGADSKIPSPAVYLPIKEFNFGDEGITITDGEGKSITVFRIQEPLHAGIVQVLQTYNNATTEVSAGGVIAKGTVYEDDEPIEIIGHATLEDLSAVTITTSDKKYKLATVRRTTLGEIRINSTFECYFDILPDSLLFPTITQGSSNINMIATSPAALSFVGHSIITHPDFGQPGLVSAYIVGLMRIYGYPFTRSFYSKELNRKATFYIHTLNNVSEFDDNDDPVPPMQQFGTLSAHFKHGSTIESNAVEIMGERFGRTDPMPRHWPNTHLGALGYINLQSVTMLNFLVEGGFKYRASQ